MYRLESGRVAVPECCVCRKPVDDVTERHNLTTHNIEITVYCHDATEIVYIPIEVAYRAGRRETIELPPRVFLRNWAEYRTTTKPERRRV